MTTRDALRACIERITDKQVRDFARFALDALCPEDHWFWRAAASSSGQHHPPACRGIGGLARHTVLAFVWLEELLRAYNKSDSTRTVNADAARLAVLLHDTRKYDSLDSLPVHGPLAADAISSLLDGDLDVVARTTIEIAALCVGTHMGLWATPPTYFGEMTPTQQVVHLADYCASRDIDPTIYFEEVIP